MFYQCLVFIPFGILAISQVSGVEIVEKYDGKRTFLEGGSLNLTCTHSNPTDERDKLIFSSNNVNMSTFTQERTYSNGMITLSIHKQVVQGDTGELTCKFNSEEETVSIEVFQDTKKKEQNRFETISTDIIDGETLKIICPVLDSLMPEVKWMRGQDELEKNERVSFADVGTAVKNGQLTLRDVVMEDRGHYTCTATWYSGQQTFTHNVRVKSHLAPLWPAIGIIVEIIILVVIILACKDRKKEADSQPLTSPSTSGSNEKGNRRKYVTTST